MPQANDFAGMQGFIWFFGRVQDRADPEQLGRVRVRCLGWHTDDVQLLPNDALPWAHVIYEPSPTPKIDPPRISDWVFGFFADGEQAQKPYILGVVPTKGAGGFADDLGDEGPLPLADRPSPTPPTPTPGPNNVGNTFVSAPAVPYTGSGTPEAATGAGGAGQTALDAAVMPTMDGPAHISTGAPGDSAIPAAPVTEPPSSYAAVYPYNKSTVSESGHQMDIDDTPGAERVNLRHRTGSGTEMQPNGNVINKTLNDNYMTVSGNCYKMVNGGETAIYGQDLKIKTGGGAGVTMQVAGGGGLQLTVDSGNISITVAGGNLMMNVNGNVNQIVSGAVKQEVGGTYEIIAGGNFSIKAPRIDLN